MAARNNPAKRLTEKEKAARQAKRKENLARRQSHDYLREKLAPAQTIGRINANTKRMQAMLEPEYFKTLAADAEMDGVMASSRLDVLNKLITNDLARLKYCLPTLKAVELKGGDTPTEIIISFANADPC